MSAYRVLARKWRPAGFDALVGQEHATRALKNALTSGRVPHGFLFTGIRGVGKTTLARLLAKCLNCAQGITPNPCDECASCLGIANGSHVDLFEVDAASRTKVDQMREILDTVRYTPAASRFKIYIMDEVHMLSIQSFNALLKTLEEPPDHVKFIFATTEVRKIPATILSRCQRFDLKRVEPETLLARLEVILKAEEVAYDQAGLMAVVRAADGSVRDALSILDQAISHGDGVVRQEEVRHLLGLTDREATLTLLADLLAGRAVEALAASDRFHQAGVDPAALLNDLLEGLHGAARLKVGGQVAPETAAVLRPMVAQTSLEHVQMLYQVLQKGVGDVKSADLPHAAMEMALLRGACLRPVPALSDLIQSISGAGSPGGGWPDKGPVGPSHPPRPAGGRVPPVSASEARPRPSPAPPSEGQGAPVPPPPSPPAGNAPARQAPAGPAGSAPPGNSLETSDKVQGHLTSWTELVHFVASRDAALGAKLKQHVVLRQWTPPTPQGPGRLLLQLTSAIYGNPDKLQEALHGYVDGQMQVSVQTAAKGQRPETLHETQTRLRDEQRQGLLARAREDDLVQSLVQRYQGRIVGVEPTGEEGPEVEESPP